MYRLAFEQMVASNGPCPGPLFRVEQKLEIVSLTTAFLTSSLESLMTRGLASFWPESKLLVYAGNNFSYTIVKVERRECSAIEWLWRRSSLRTTSFPFNFCHEPEAGVSFVSAVWELNKNLVFVSFASADDF